MSIFDTIRQAKAAAEAAKKGQTRAEPQKAAPSTASQTRAGQQEAKPAVPAKPVTAFGMKMPMRRPLPPGVVVQPAPDPTMTFDEMAGLSTAGLEYGDDDFKAEDEDDDDTLSGFYPEEDEDGAGEDHGDEGGTSLGFGGFEIQAPEDGDEQDQVAVVEVETGEPPEAEPEPVEAGPSEPAKPKLPAGFKPIGVGPAGRIKADASVTSAKPSQASQPVTQPGQPSHWPLKPGFKPLAPKPSAPKETKVETWPEAEKVIAEATAEAPRKPVIDPDSPLGKLRAQSAAAREEKAKVLEAFDPPAAKPAAPVIKGMTLPKTGAMSGLSPVAKDMIEQAKVEKVYSVDQYLEDWKELPDAPDDPDQQDIADFNAARADLIRRACARIDQIFKTELAGLSVAQANDYSTTEIANLVKLTFLRVKEAPGAYAVLDLEDRAQLIKGMRAMAAKRNAAVKSRKPSEAKELSAAMEAMGITEETTDFAGFDLTQFGV